MDLKRLRRQSNTLITLGAVALGVTALLLLGQTARNPADFGRAHLLILAVNVIGVGVLLLLIIANLYRLVREYLQQMPGSRLKTRMVVTLVGLSVLPLVVVYIFAVDFLSRGVDTWFDAELEQELSRALKLSRASLDVEMRQRLATTRELPRAMEGVGDIAVGRLLSDLRSRSGARELTLYGENLRIVASSAEDPGRRLPEPLPDDVLLQVRQTGSYLVLESVPDGYQIRTLVVLSRDPARREQEVLQAIYPVGERLWQLADAVQATYTEYAELRYLRGPLKTASVMTLTLVLLLTMLAAVFGAFFFTRRLVAPIESLVAGTRAVAEGDFDTHIPATSADEVGFLIRSFNAMIDRLRKAREETGISQRALESERANLATILARLSTGVIALDPDGRIRIANEAAASILGVDLSAHVGEVLEHVARDQPLLKQFRDACHERLDAGETEWREQLVLQAPSGARRMLNCASTALPAGPLMAGGCVLVFDDITLLLQVQRDAAWGEVARRLAHEIKNPLTPIRLAAERIRRRYLGSMAGEEAQVLDRSTHTIVQQVEAMRDMVNAFSDYARAPELWLVRFDLNQLVREVAYLYKAQEPHPVIVLRLDESLGEIDADPVRVRQLLHNLIRNALEALEGAPGATVTIETAACTHAGQDFARIVVSDNGPGIAADALPDIFEPYITTKKKGTGLGLAIVKKLVEDHGGGIQAENQPTGGARITLNLPLRARSRTVGAEPGAPDQMHLRERA